MLFFLPRLNRIYTRTSTFQRPTVSRNRVYRTSADIKTNIQLRKQMEYIQAVRQPIRVYHLRRPKNAFQNTVL
jgi:hypothetical protein